MKSARLLERSKLRAASKCGRKSLREKSRSRSAIGVPTSCAMRAASSILLVCTCLKIAMMWHYVIDYRFEGPQCQLCANSLPNLCIISPAASHGGREQTNEDVRLWFEDTTTGAAAASSQHSESGRSKNPPKSRRTPHRRVPENPVPRRISAYRSITTMLPLSKGGTLRTHIDAPYRERKSSPAPNSQCPRELAVYEHGVCFRYVEGTTKPWRVN